jgi:hypothetical protein
VAYQQQLCAAMRADGIQFLFIVVCPPFTMATFWLAPMQECMAIERELEAWQRAGGFGERENALR